MFGTKSFRILPIETIRYLFILRFCDNTCDLIEIFHDSVSNTPNADDFCTRMNKHISVWHIGGSTGNILVGNVV